MTIPIAKKIGDKYIHLARTSIAQHFHADECTDLTALNLTVYASPASSFAANSCDRFSVIGCQIRIKPGRWHSSNGDGIHCQRNRTGPWIENCLIEGIIDDPTNIYSMRSELIEQVDEHTLKIKAKKPRTFKTPDAIGKPLILLNNRTGQIISSCTIKRIVAMTGLVALTNTAITFAVPLLMPGLFTTDFEVMRLMRHAAPWAAAGLLMHPPVVGMEGCLLATKDIRWLVRNYVLTGGLSVLATQLLLKLTPLRRVLDLNAIWIYLATYQGVRFLTFQWRLLLSSSGILRRSLRAQPAAKKATGKDA